MSSIVYTHAELRDILQPILQRYSMASARLFGSYARQEATPESDIDVLVRAGDGEPFDVLAVAEDLHRATGKSVDVYEESELRPGAFRDAVLREAVAL